GCDDSPTGIDSLLVGSWTTGRQNAIYEFILNLSSDGTFEYRIEEYNKSDKPTAWTRVRGTYIVDGNALRFSPAKAETWSIYATDPNPRPVSAPATLFEDCTYELPDGRLRLRYISYPADAP